MRYIYRSLHHIRGLSRWPSATDELVYCALHGTIRALLTCDPTPHTEQLDTAVALGRSLLPHLAGPRNNDRTLEERVAGEVQRIREERANKYRGRPVFLFFEARGEIADPRPRKEMDFGPFFVWMDGVSKSSILETHGAQVCKILSVISMAFESVVGFENVADGVVLFKEGEPKPIYSFTFRGTANLTVCRVPAPEKFAFARQLAAMIFKDNGLDRVLGLLSDSLQANQSILHRFLFAWTALEIFVNTNFGRYEQEFLNAQSAGADGAIDGRYVNRGRGVSGKKYSLTNKFVRLADVLDPAAAKKEIGVFNECKERRNDLVHEGIVPKTGLPVEPVQRLIRKLLREHLNRSRGEQ